MNVSVLSTLPLVNWMSQYMIESSSSDTGHSAVLVAVCEIVKFPVLGDVVVIVNACEKAPFLTVAAIVYPTRLNAAAAAVRRWHVIESVSPRLKLIDFVIGVVIADFPYGDEIYSRRRSNQIFPPLILPPEKLTLALSVF